jgi:HAD superfamily hydrolase (TIGR01509 family)
MLSSIKLICFDYDGVIADLRNVHYEALNTSLAEIDPKFTITMHEHISIYDGLSTKHKLTLLSQTKDFPTDAKIHTAVFEHKQVSTIEAIKRNIKPNPYLQSVLQELRARGYVLVLVSNAIHDTIYAGMIQLGVWSLFDRVYCNTDCTKQKPHPEIYLRAMVDMGFGPDETLIVEDSKHGREAAYRSGAFVCGVDSPDDLTLARLEMAIYNAKPKLKRWTGGGINIVIPMSGLGARFTKAGYKMPKPLIDVAGKPMIQRVIENIPIDGRFIFILQKAHYDGYYLGTLLNSIAPGCEIITVDGQTQGAACTVLKAVDFIHNNEHLLIANSDQWIDWNVDSFMWSMIASSADGGILTFKDDNPKWSFAKVGNDGWVSEVAEKRPISNNATCGFYYYKRGREFVEYANQMIAKDIRVNNEFYVCPAFNEAISAGKKIKTHECLGMYGMGLPEDLEATLQSKIFE